MTYDVEINGRVRRVDLEQAAGGLTATIDGQRHAADVTVINGVWSLILEREPIDARSSDARPSDAGPSDTRPSDARPGNTAPRRSHSIAIVERPPGSGSLTVHVAGRQLSAAVGAARASHSGRRTDAASGTPSAGARQPAAVSITAPMPGKVVKVLVRPGDVVAARQGVVVVEAMKMENELRAPKAGTVTAIKVTEGASVEAGAVLAVIG